MKLPRRLYQSELFRFMLAGTAGFAVDYCTVLFCVKALGMSPYLARFFSFLAAVATTYVINTRFTFSRRISEGGKTPGLLPYLLCMLAGLAVNYACYAVGYKVLENLLPVAAVLLLTVGMGSLAGMLVNFALCRFCLYKGRSG